MASNTRCRGASNIRVMAISRSDGVVIFSVLSTLASTALLLLRLLLGSRFGFHGLIGLQFFQIVVEAIEVLVPEAAETSQPAIGVVDAGMRVWGLAEFGWLPGRDADRYLDSGIGLRSIFPAGRGNRRCGL